MNAQKLWPTVQVLGRTLISNKTEIINHGVRAYSHPPNIGNCHYNIVPQNFLVEESNFLSQNLFKVGRGSYVKVVSRQLSTGTYLFCREFNDGENEHAHDILCSMPAYEATILDVKRSKENYDHFTHWAAVLNKNWTTVDNQELVESFVNLSKISNQHSLEIEDKQFHSLCNIISERTGTMDDDQLMQLLVALSRWPSTQSKNSSNFLLLWNALDTTCASRIRTWDLSKIFLVADHWYALRLSKISVYFTKIMIVVGNKLASITPHQFVQFMFYANLNRDLGYVKEAALISKIRESIKNVSIEELGIIAMGLFKTQTNIINDQLNNEIIKKTTENLDNVSDHALGSILKFLNKSLPGSAYGQCYDLLEIINPVLNKFNNLVFLQVALLGNNLLVFHEEVLEKVGTRFGSCISNLRLKDIERFTYTMMLYKFIAKGCPNVVNDIICELRKPERVVEINHFPKCFVSCVNYLVTMGYFPLDLISASFQPSMLQLLHSMNSGEMGRELNEMNWSLKIEGPPFYPGYQLDPIMSHNLTKKHLGRIPCYKSRNLTHQERLLLDVKSKLIALLGNEAYTTAVIILPHFSHPDIVFCTNHRGEPVAIPPDYHSLPVESLKFPMNLDAGLSWNVIILGGRNSYIRNSLELRGNLEMKKRQLRKIGYNVTVVPYSSYNKRSNKYKLACLERYLEDTSLNTEEARVTNALSTLKLEERKAATYSVAQ